MGPHCGWYGVCGHTAMIKVLYTTVPKSLYPIAKLHVSSLVLGGTRDFYSNTNYNNSLDELFQNFLALGDIVYVHQTPDIQEKWSVGGRQQKQV